MRNQYLEDSLNNFVNKELIWIIFVSASITIKTENYNLLQKYIRVRRMNLNPNFLNWIKQLFTLLYLHSCNVIHNKLPTNFRYCFLYSEYYAWKINCSLWIWYSFLETNLLLLTRYTCRKIVIIYLLRVFRKKKLASIVSPSTTTKVIKSMFSSHHVSLRLRGCLCICYREMCVINLYQWFVEPKPINAWLEGP